MKARRVRSGLTSRSLPRPRAGPVTDRCQRAMDLYTQLWGSDPRPTGDERILLQAELLVWIDLLTPPERARYYRHVGQVVTAPPRRPGSKP